MTPWLAMALLTQASLLELQSLSSLGMTTVSLGADADLWMPVQHLWPRSEGITKEVKRALGNFGPAPASSA